MRNLLWIAIGPIVFIAGCASQSAGVKGAASSEVEAQLKVSAGSGKLKAKLNLKNNTSREIDVKNLDSKFFSVQTIKDEPMALKNSKGEVIPTVHLKPGEAKEIAFSLQDNYSFWDRLTKYKIWYEGDGLKSNVAQVWF